MTPSDIPHDMSFSFGPDLREVPSDPCDMKSGVAFLQSQLENSVDQDDAAQIQDQLGVYQRIILDLEGSRNSLTSALDFYKKNEDELKTLISNIRLAHTLQWMKNFEQANSLLEKALKISQDHPRYNSHQDFALQHLGKLRFDQGLYQQAEDYFRRALFLREKKGIADLIQSTKYSLMIVEELTR